MSYFVELSELDNAKTYRLVGEEDVKSSFFTGEYLRKLAQDKGREVLIVNDSNEPIIVKLIDKQKYLYDQKKAKKDQEKRQKASAQKQKEIKFHLNIASNDLNTKVNHIKEFLEKNSKIKVTVEMRGREVDMKSMARDLMDKIISNFTENTVEPVKDMGSSLVTFISK